MTPARRFVGRQGERRALTSALERAAAGEPQVVVVTGDAGIGKTRLVEEVTGQAGPDWLVAVGHCVEAGMTGLPYAPLFGVLGAIAASPHGRPLLDHAAQAAPGLLPLLGGEPSRPPVDTTSGLAQLRLFDSLMRLLGDLAETQPTLVVIEDLHWADQSTTAFLPFLCRNLVRQPIAAVLTSRTDELHRTHPLRLTLGELARLPSVTVLELGPLSGAELAELLTDQLGTAVHPRVVRAIAGRSGGNPFFAEQLLEAGEDAMQGAVGPLPVELADVLHAPRRPARRGRQAPAAGRVPRRSAHRARPAARGGRKRRGDHGGRGAGMRRRPAVRARTGRGRVRLPARPARRGDRR